MSVVCDEIADTYSARDLTALARVLNLTGSEQLCPVVESFDEPAQAALASSSQGALSRGREVATFLRYVRDSPALFVAINKSAVHNIEAQFTEQGADVETAFWYGLLVGPCMSQGFSFPSGLLRLPDDLGAHESALREYWSWQFSFDDQSTLYVLLQRRTPNAPFSWLPDVSNSRSVFKLLVSDSRGTSNGTPSVAGGNGLVQVDSQPFNVTVGTALVLTSVDSSPTLEWSFRVQQPGFDVSLVCRGSDEHFVRTGPEDLGHFALIVEGSVNGSAAQGTASFRHGWTSLQDQDGFQVGYFNRAIHVFPNRSDPGSGIQSRARWTVDLGGEAVLLFEVGYLYDFGAWQTATAQFIRRGSSTDVAVRFRVTDSANGPLTTTPYGTNVMVEAVDKTWSLRGTTSGFVNTDNLFWDSVSVWELRAQSMTCAGSFLLDDFQVNRDDLRGWWYETSRQAALDLRQGVESVCAVDGGGDTELFAWPRPSAGQATAVFFLFLSPFLLVGLLLFAILFGWKVGRDRNASES